MWNYQQLNRIDLRMVAIILLLMFISLLVISAHTGDRSLESTEEVFFTPTVKTQIQWFLIGGIIFVICAAFDYNKLREWSWILYALMIVALVGLFFTDAIQRVHRWYRLPFINYSFQPSEYAKLIVVITLSWFLERRKAKASYWSTALFGAIIVGIPFILILKQPDLGTALVLFPIALVMFYYGDLRPQVIRVMASLAGIALFIVAIIFLGIIPHETLRPYATKIMKEYQYKRGSIPIHIIKKLLKLRLL